MLQQKICKSCSQEKPVTSYHKNKGCLLGVAPTCKDCRNKRGRERYVEDPEASMLRYKSAYIKEAEDHVGDWGWHFKKLISRGDRKALTVEGLLIMLAEQSGYCAISGVELTCVRGTGERLSTNISIDRIEAGGPYIISNIRLVCRAVNAMRSNMTDTEFIWWCKQVVSSNK